MAKKTKTIDVYLYAEETLEVLERTHEGVAVCYPKHVAALMPDNCPGENTEEVFEELGWELAMAELQAFGSAR